MRQWSLHFVNFGGALLKHLVAAVAEHFAGDPERAFFVHGEENLALGGRVQVEDGELVQDDLAGGAGT